jgi:hypothetical protein
MSGSPSPWSLGGLTVRELARRVWRELSEDEVTERGAAGRPGDDASIVQRTLEEILAGARGGLLSVGALAALWAGSNLRMLWLYLTGVVLLVGAEINAEIEHAAAERGNATAKAPGEQKAPADRAA